MLGISFVRLVVGLFHLLLEAFARPCHKVRSDALLNDVLGQMCCPMLFGKVKAFPVLLGHCLEPMVSRRTIKGHSSNLPCTGARNPGYIALVGPVGPWSYISSRPSFESSRMLEYSAPMVRSQGAAVQDMAGSSRNNQSIRCYARSLG